MAYEISVDKKKCIGCGSCVNICPENFFMNGNKADVKKRKKEELDCEEEAMQSCPVGAISIKKK